MRTSIILATVIAGLQLSAHAAPQATSANVNTTVCGACHGSRGEGMAAANYPRLAGLNATYLARQLHAFKTGERNSPVMAPMTTALSDADIDALADYYAALPAPSLPPVSMSEQQLEQGKTLANLGRWSDNIPACVQCHGPDGVGVPPHFPAISNQYAGYIVQQLQAWQSGQRKGDPDDLMATVAKRMSEADMQAVAAWFQAVPAGAPDSAK